MEGNAGRVGWGEPREGVEGTERTRSGRRGPQAPQRLVIQNPHFSTTGLPSLFPIHQLHKRTCGSTAIYSTPRRKGTIHLQTSMSSPGFESRSFVTEASVANHYTGWVTVLLLLLLMASV
ncbi:hypothetical protein TNCV_2658811 [Trichonephila clavipes]|nr:hypothetical protein TNCV_2658811 [Trichonephila clavipes]